MNRVVCIAASLVLAAILLSDMSTPRDAWIGAVIFGARLLVAFTDPINLVVAAICVVIGQGHAWRTALSAFVLFALLQILFVAPTRVGIHYAPGFDAVNVLIISAVITLISTGSYAVINRVRAARGNSPAPRP